MEDITSFIVKRDGTQVPFDSNKIFIAIQKAMKACDHKLSDNSGAIQTLTNQVCNRLLKLSSLPTVEQCQDIVEEILMEAKYHKIAKAYIIYREEHAKLRGQAIPEEWKRQARKALSYFGGVKEYIVYLRTYAKWIPEKNRREIWPETVDRFMNFMREIVQDKLSESEYNEVKEAILKMDIMPSMRMLQFSGGAARRNNICAYNCSFIAPRRLRDFHDTMLILMCGCGVGFSVEKRFIDLLPVIEYQESLEKSGSKRKTKSSSKFSSKRRKVKRDIPVDTSTEVDDIKLHVISDSREGWCEALLLGLEHWYNGKDIKFDYSLIRPAGARLITSGGRASGPAPLKELLEFSRSLILDNQGNKLSTINVHDLMCKIGKIVLVGGVRRCLVSDTLVSVRRGTKKIKDIVVGDEVVTENGFNKVTAVYNQGYQKVLELKHEYGTIRCTPNHRIAIGDKDYDDNDYDWVEAGKLKPGDKINYLTRYDSLGPVITEVIPIISIKEIPGEYMTYDIEVEDDHCFYAEDILVHNSSEISLSDLDDEAMRNAKTGAFWNTHPDRGMANNSAVYNKKPTDAELLMEWNALVQSGSGERGIFVRDNLSKHLPERRLDLIEDLIKDMGCNPCAEILLLPYEFCNLTTVVMRNDDNRRSLLRKMRLATILGTYQSMLTDFKGIAPEWKELAQMERLLGVSLNGQRDCKYLQKHLHILDELKQVAINTNVKYAKRFGINRSAAITTVKPEGTSSQMLGTSSGIHARFAPYYIRRIRITATDPLAKLLIDQGVPHHPENGQSLDNVNTWVFEFPEKSPDGAICADQLSALDQLEYWKEVKTRYTEHNPSCTIYVRKHEWITTLHWIQQNWDIVGGLSFLPYDDHVYELAPYEKITKGEIRPVGYGNARSRLL